MRRRLGATHSAVNLGSSPRSLLLHDLLFRFTTAERKRYPEKSDRLTHLFSGLEENLFWVFILLLSHFGGLIFLFWIFLKSAFLIPLMNLISPFICMHPIWSYGPWKLSTKCLLIKSKQFPSLVSFLPKRKKKKKTPTRKVPPLVCASGYLTAHCWDSSRPIR